MKPSCRFRLGRLSNIRAYSQLMAAYLLYITGQMSSKKIARIGSPSVRYSYRPHISGSRLLILRASEGYVKVKWRGRGIRCYRHACVPTKWYRHMSALAPYVLAVHKVGLCIYCGCLLVVWVLHK